MRLAKSHSIQSFRAAFSTGVSLHVGKKAILLLSKTLCSLPPQLKGSFFFIRCGPFLSSHGNDFEIVCGWTLSNEEN
jgi:hypothetical protein